MHLPVKMTGLFCWTTKKKDCRVSSASTARGLFISRCYVPRSTFAWGTFKIKIRMIASMWYYMEIRSLVLMILAPYSRTVSIQQMHCTRTYYSCLWWILKNANWQSQSAGDCRLRWLPSIIRSIIGWPVGATNQQKILVAAFQVVNLTNTYSQFNIWICFHCCSAVFFTWYALLLCFFYYQLVL